MIPFYANKEEYNQLFTSTSVLVDRRSRILLSGVLLSSKQSLSMNYFIRVLTSLCSSMLQMSQTPVSIVRIGISSRVFSHSSCLSCTFFRQDRGIPSSPARFLCFILSRHNSGEHLRQITALRGQSLISFLQIVSQIWYYPSSMFPQRYIISPKMWRSARGDLSEKCSFCGSSEMVLFQRRLRECRAWSWKVKAQRFGFSQKFLRMSPPDMVCHSSTGSLIVAKLKRDKRLLLPAPRLPSIEITPDIFVLLLNRQMLNQIKAQEFKSKKKAAFQNTHSSLSTSKGKPTRLPLDSHPSTLGCIFRSIQTDGT